MSSDPPISEEDLKKAVVEMAACPPQFNAKYAVIGGMATTYRSQPRFTKDVDILLAIPQVALPGLLHELDAGASSSISTKSFRNGPSNT